MDSGRRFSQCYVSDGLSFFREQVLSSWKCKEYSDENSPAVFIGIYHNKDIECFTNHKGHKILFLGGSDFQNVSRLPRQKKAYCPVFSRSLEYRLTKAGILCKNWPVSIRDFSGIPRGVPLGEKIYVYSGNHKRGYIDDSSGLNKSLYRECIHPLVEEFGEDCFLFASGFDMPTLIEQVYRNCFIFVKPNELGGNSTMWELAHMGRKTVASGMYDSPNIINMDLDYKIPIKARLRGRNRFQYYPTVNVRGYKHLDRVIAAIKVEREKVGTNNSKLAAEVESMLGSLPWLNLEFWGV